jgi:hypothetical protein
MTAEQHGTKSPSGALLLELDSASLVVKGRVTSSLTVVLLWALPLVAIAEYLVLPLGKSTGSSVWVGFGLLAYAGYLLNLTRSRTTLRLAGEHADVTQARLLMTSRKRVRLNPSADPSIESDPTENGYEYVRFMRLKLSGGSHFNVLHGHTADDIVWVLEASSRWREGKAGEQQPVRPTCM